MVIGINGVKHTYLNKHNASIIGLVETNIDWNFKNIKAATNITNKVYKQASISTSSSMDPTRQDYLPGGTSTLVTNNLSGHIVERICDSELGRWSGFKLRGKNNRFIYVISCYRPHEDTKYGTNTCFQQQWRLMRKNNIDNPNPRQQVLDDLSKQIIKWTYDGSEIILMMDANESVVEATDNKLNNFLNKSKLTSLINNCVHNAPSTYARGKKCIDYIFGTYGLVPYVKNQGYLAFYQGAWSSDHRALYIDLDKNALFGLLVEEPDEQKKRGVSSNDRQSIQKFLNVIHKDSTIEELLSKLIQLESHKNWTKLQHDELEHIDVQFTKILTKADQMCTKKPKFAWSLELHQASLILRFWRIKLKELKNKIDARSKLYELQEEIKDDILLGISGELSTKSIHFHIKRAKRLYDTIRRDAIERRETFLTTRQEYLIANDEMTKAAAVKQILYAETCKRTFKSFQRFTKPTYSAGGLSHLLLVNEENEVVEDVQGTINLVKALIKRNTKHFKQAHGTPFTLPQLLKILDSDGFSPESMKIIDDGIIPNDIPPTIVKILLEVRRQRQALSSHFPFLEMIHGFKKWRESTVTSPSNKHLGIYKALIMAYELGMLSDKETISARDNSTAAVQHEDRNIINSGSNNSLAYKCLLIQHKIINIAIQQCHTYKRWQIVHNFFLENIPGRPIINKLRVIHLYEADWNIILKYFIAYKLIQQSHKEKTLCEEQAGGRPGRSSDSAATKTVITLEVCRLQQLNGAIMYNDAASCYERIIENISNVCCIKEGLNIQIAKLHAQTLQSMKYHIKHKNGVSEEYNTNSAQDPFYGTGQGSGDSGARWGFISDTLIRAYNKNSHSATLTGPISHREIDERIAAFVDDTRQIVLEEHNTITNVPAQLHQHNTHFVDNVIKVPGQLMEPNNLNDSLMVHLKHDVQLWESLLHGSGGKLELGKCRFTKFKWKHDIRGQPILMNDVEIGPPLHIQDSATNNKLCITEISAKDEYKLLGVYISADGTPEQQSLAMKEKCMKFESIFSQINLNHRGIDLGYKCILIPSLRYVLPASNILNEELDDMQQRLINILLPKLGFNRHFPRQVVYAAEDFGGLGILDLATEQGIAHVNVLMSNIRAKTSLGTLFIILLESYQIAAGMIESPLIDTVPRDYISSPWMDTTRSILFKSKSQIILCELIKLQKIRIHDEAIMDLARKHDYSTSKMQMINICRIYLQVTTIAEISNDMGTHILECAFHGSVNDITKKPILWDITTSRLRWPRQVYPSKHAWNIWKKFLLNCLIKPGTQTALKVHFGAWLPNCHSHRLWHYSSINRELYFSPNEKHYYRMIANEDFPHKSNRKEFIIQNNYSLYTSIERSLPLTPTNIQNGSIILEESRLGTNFMSYDQPTEDWYDQISSNLTIEIKSPLANILSASSLYCDYHVETHYTSTMGWTISDNRNIILSGGAMIPSVTHETPLRHHIYCSLIIMKAYTKYMQNMQCPVQNKKIIIRSSFNQLPMHVYEHNKFQDKPPSKCMVPNFELLNSLNKDMRALSGCIIQSYTTNKDPLVQTICLKHANIIQHKILPDATLEHQSATLLINAIEVNANIFQEMRKAINSQDLVDYFKKKYDWRPSTLDDIDWEMHSNAIKQLRGNIKKTILQHVHSWLPVNANKSTGNQGDSCICSRCRKCDETTEHFLSYCDEATEDWNMVSNNIKSFLTNKTDPMLTKLLLYALDNWRNVKHPEYPQFLPDRYISLFQKQQCIGWNQILKGRLTVEWVRHHDKYERQQTTKNLGTKIFQQVITKVFRSIYIVWKNRCNIQHNKEQIQEMNYNHRVNIEKVRKLYRQKDNIGVCDRQLFDTPIESITSLPAHQIKKWVTRNEYFIRDAIKRYKQQVKVSTHSIRNYFTAQLPVTTLTNIMGGKSKKVKKVPMKAKHKAETRNPKSLSHLSTAKKKQSRLNFKVAHIKIVSLTRYGSHDNAQFQPP